MVKLLTLAKNNQFGGVTSITKVKINNVEEAQAHVTVIKNASINTVKECMLIGHEFEWFKTNKRYKELSYKFPKIKNWDERRKMVNCYYYKLVSEKPVCTYRGQGTCQAECDAIRTTSPITDLNGDRYPGPSYVDRHAITLQIPKTYASPGASYSADSYAMIDEQNRAFKSYQNTFRSNRKRQMGCDISFQQTGRAYLHIGFDDGTVEGIPVDSLVGEPICMTIRLAKELKVEKTYFEIVFEKSFVVITGELNKIHKREYLYYLFCDAGVCFPKNLKKSEISQALIRCFSEKLANTEKKVILNHLGGWNIDGKKYCKSSNAENAIYKFLEDKVAELPINSKILSNGDMDFARYIQTYEKIEDVNVRKILMALPFLALTYSLFSPQIVRQVGPILIRTSIQNFDSVYSLLSIFCEYYGRQAISLAEKSSEIVKFAASRKDEIAVFTASYESAESDYARKKILEHMKMVINLANGQTLPSPYNRKMPALTVILTDYIPVDRTVNGYLLSFEDEVFITGGNVLRPVWSVFVNWAENHFDEVVEKLCFHKNIENPFVAFSNTWKLMTTFFESKGENLGEEPSWKDALFNLNTRADILTQFKYSLTNAVLDRQAKVNIRYKSGFYLFETSDWCRLLKALGFSPYKMLLLKQLKENGWLSAEETSGYSYRVEIDGGRREFYRVKGEFLDNVGEPKLSNFIPAVPTISKYSVNKSPCIKKTGKTQPKPQHARYSIEFTTGRPVSERNKNDYNEKI